MTKQDKDNAKNFKPLQIHALWLIFSHHMAKNQTPTKASIFQLLKGIDESSYKKLKVVSKELKLTQGSSWELTKIGLSFAQSKHWRLWIPPKILQPHIQKNGLRNCFLPKNFKRQNVIDLFAGVGGITKGFEEAGFNVVLGIDNDDHACEAHQLNFFSSKVVNKDIFEVAKSPKKEIGKLININSTKVHGIVGGPPCQGFSYIGERAHEDERNLLTSKFMDIVLNLKPDFFLMENVPGLINAGNPPKFSIHLSRLAKSIGEPANIIIETLPTIPKSVAARDFQYRKRIVSGSIKASQVKIKNLFRSYGNSDLLNLEIAANIAEESHKILKNQLYEDLKKSYKDSKLAKAAINACIKEKQNIAIIAIASIADEFIKEKLINDNNCEDFLKSITLNIKHDKILKNSSKHIFSKFDDAPKSTMKFGIKIGPILSHLIERAEPYYVLSKPTILNAALYGCPQNRNRLFLVGIRKDLKKTFTFPPSTHSDSDYLTSSMAIDDLPNIDLIESLIEGHEISTSHTKEPSCKYQKLMRLHEIDNKDFSLPRPSWNPYRIDCSNRTQHAEHVLKRLKNLKPGTQDATSHKSRLDPNKPSHTLRAGTKGNKGSHTAVRPIHYKDHRVVSVREGARLMGYADWMTFHKTKWHGFRLVGNGVTSQISSSIASAIKKLIYK